MSSELGKEFVEISSNEWQPCGAALCLHRPYSSEPVMRYSAGRVSGARM